MPRTFVTGFGLTMGFEMNDPSADEIVARLGLVPHPEGGHYRETFRHRPDDGGRGAVTVIYYLLRAGERSAWHRIDAVEIWHFYAGAPLELLIADPGGRTAVILGTDFAAGMAAHGVVPALAWQSARSLGAWTLVGCTVAPAFDFKGFELAPAEWTPP
jgi:predicted cupin superfamily sugar epimerase